MKTFTIVVIAAIALTSHGAMAQVAQHDPTQRPAVQYKEIIQEAPNSAVTQVELEGYRQRFHADWARKVTIDRSHLVGASTQVQLLFTPEPGQTFFLNYRSHEDYESGAATAWNGDIRDGTGATVGFFSAVSSPDGYVRIQASTGDSTFNVVPLGDQAGQLLLYEVGLDPNSEHRGTHSHSHSAADNYRTKEKVEAARERLRTDEEYQRITKEYEAYNEAIRAKAPGRRSKRTPTADQEDNSVDNR